MEAKERLNSLDQLRGWAIVTMMLVNFFGKFKVMPDTFRHYRVGFTFADHVAPIFLFAAGMGLWLSFQSLAAKTSLAETRWRSVKKFCGLLLVSCLYFVSLDLIFFQKNILSILLYTIWNPLTYIPLAGFLALVFLQRGIWARTLAAVAYLAIFQIISDWGYGDWLWHNSVDGGPLGPMSWAFPLFAGTIAAEILKFRNRKLIIVWCLAAGSGLCLAGYLLAWQWQFSQRLMTCSYAVASSGIGFLIFLGFYLLSDVWQKSLPHLSTFGKNALALYILHLLIITLLVRATPWFGRNASVAVALIGFTVLYGICYGVAYFLERRKIFLKF